MENSPVILFDGYCNLCNRSVNFILRHDRKQRLRFMPLQDSRVNSIFFDIRIPEDADSVLLIKNRTVYQESDAALEICRFLDFPWNLMVIFRIVPRYFRDKIYRYIAGNRYKWFGKRENCRVPRPDGKDRFL